MVVPSTNSQGLWMNASTQCSVKSKAIGLYRIVHQLLCVSSPYYPRILSWSCMVVPCSRYVLQSYRNDEPLYDLNHSLPQDSLKIICYADHNWSWCRQIYAIAAPVCVSMSWEGKPGISFSSEHSVTDIEDNGSFLTFSTKYSII